MSDLVVGTDRRTVMSAAPSAGAAPLTRTVPAGLRHAVPSGARLALCGEAPAVRWDAEPWPGMAKTSDLCPTCSCVDRSRGL